MKRQTHRNYLEFTVVLAALIVAQSPSPAADLQIAPGRFSSRAGSLTNYACPEWFRDAKFGIWAHWGPQAVPRAGDWYARNMYLQGSPQYESHLKNYGHPSTNGYKDIIPLWKAEKWDPDALMALYVKAGAKYFVSMGVHHDNFDLWNSKFHSWNAVKMGPHRDIVGDWKKAAEKYGMRFGVSEHLGPSFGWYAPSHGYDQFWEPGARLGIPYDGADPKYQELYHPDNNEPFRWGPSWYATNSAWHQEWFNRIKDLLDQSQPDLLYTDGGIPFGEFGRSLLAHFYNANAAAHGGHLEAVYTFKNLGTGEFIREAGVEDVERGVMKDINPLPWQTCTSMGDWFYSDGFKYKTTAEVVHMLADIVSKNGNMLLNVVQYADGSLPPESRQFLDEMAAWMAVNGEAIYGTRPWKIFGEGPTVAAAGHFKEDTAYTPQDIRFTTKGGQLYALALGWPAEGTVVITSLAKTDDAGVNTIQRVELLGSKEELKFTQSTDGLMVELPAQKTSDIACALKITGGNLQPVKSSAPASVIRPQADGRLILTAPAAQLHGSELRLETQGGLPDIGFWVNGEEWVSWMVRFPQAGVFMVSATVAAVDFDNSFVVEVGGEKISAQVPVTAAWDAFQTNDLGRIEIRKPGVLMVKVRASDAGSWRPINLNSIQFTPVTALAGAVASPIPGQTAAKAAAQPESLTPPAPDTPRINGPHVFGVRPNSPFFFSIPATGERPMDFSAKGLPKGLKLDAATGRITGSLKKAGEFKVKLRAKNALGSAEKNLRIVVGERIALTPPLGWNSWNCWGDKIDADKVLRSARALVASGLDQHGWSYINIDDAWQGARSGPLNALQPDPRRFPDLKSLCDGIHSLGLKVGIYSTPWTVSYAGRPGGSSENSEGKWDPNANFKAPKNKNVLPFAIGKYSFTEADAKQWAAWGIDYVKFDWGPVTAPPAAAMHQALRATGRDIVLSLSNNHEQNLFNEIEAVSQTAEAWRTTGDIYDDWGRVKDIGFSQDKWAPFGGPGHWNDPDMLVVGQVGWGRPHPTKLTPDEQYTHISLWCLLSAPLLIGCDLEKLDAFTFGLLSNDEVLAVNQDSLGKQAVCVATDGDLRVYAKDLEDGSKAVGLFNLGNSEATVTANWTDLKLSGKQTVRDLWRQKDLGAFRNEFSAPVPRHGVVLLRLGSKK